MTESPPMPLEWHPAYRDMTYLLDWLNGDGGYPTDRIMFAKPRKLTASFSTADTSPTGPSIDTYAMTKRRCAGPAPYVGRPFAYSWWAGVDDFGRRIAGESTRQYNPADEVHHWGRDPLSLPLRHG